jgi:predicted ATPase
MTEPTADIGAAEPAVPFIRRVRIRNYKSIAECDVRLGPLTVLVGPNGAGKSNFLDALAFTARALETTPAEALDERGGLREVLRRVPERAHSFSISIDAVIPWWPSTPVANAHYQFEIGSAAENRLAFEVISEECVIEGHNGAVARFSAGLGRSNFVPSGRSFDAAVFDSDRLLLPTAGTQGDFARLYTGLTRPRFYNFRTEVLRRPQRPSARAVLRSDGEGFGDVLGTLADVADPWVKKRIDAYLSAILQNECVIEPLFAGEFTTVALKTKIEGREFEFSSLGMSDGTIRGAAVLAALFQPESLDGRLPLLGIEEPESALHPAAAGALFDALTEAAEHVQIIAASQSADLLDREDFDVSTIRPVALQDGLTIIGEVDSASREIAREKLMTLGELMRGNQLVPSPPEGTDSES